MADGTGHSIPVRGGRYLAPRAPVAFASVALYLAVVLALLWAILHRNGGVFTYTLDDPYIHLALAEKIAQGHYGINSGEASAPSSSIVWPFLLAPGARPAWGTYLPLALNTIFCGLAVWRSGGLAHRTHRRWLGGGI